MSVSWVPAVAREHGAGLGDVSSTMAGSAAETQHSTLSHRAGLVAEGTAWLWSDNLFTGGYSNYSKIRL